ncbi:DUF7779 domain-containing protein [Streptomyces sp. NPDC002285]
MLQLASLLDANGIPGTVLTSQPALAHLAAHRTRPEPPDNLEPVSRRDAQRALSALHRLSLIDQSPATPHGVVRVHQLIQRATRDALRLDQYEQIARTAADALLGRVSKVDLGL